MKKLLFLSFFLFAFTMQAFAQEKFAYRIELNDEIISPVSAEYIATSLEQAEKDHAAFLLIQLDTPGGLLSSTRTIVKRIVNANIPVIVYVSPSGSRAGSAGVFISYAAHLVAMAPSTNIGAAHPVNVGGEKKEEKSWKDIFQQFEKKEKQPSEDKPRNTSPSTEKSHDPMEDKIMNDTLAWIEGLAKLRGRNEAWARLAVSESVSITAEKALQEKVINFIATNRADLLRQLDGVEVKVGEKTITLDTKHLELKILPQDFRLRLLTFLAHPNIAYILMMLGFYGLLFEFTHPGFGFPGVAGSICLVLAFFGMQILPTNYAGVALIALSVLLFIAEAQAAGFGLFGVGGIISLFFGSLILFDSPHQYMRVSLHIIIAVTFATTLIVSFLMSMLFRMRNQKVVTGSEGMIGLVGEVSSWKGYEGSIFVHGEIWHATSDSTFSAGDKVRVDAMNGLKLQVKSISSSQ
ncbi:MAG: serine protease [Deltaproteobacteria bacterium CG11_big_fil_rev_8_21_14_0_20_42_23]|nr:MAG: serine protease [Deltaproteobacteria bacterium CG11_big_fil_rev_8_21_14_0_20_42_23]PJC63337.1 MAG: serine protease [Deltaproteobacteria bacterium CG_4_9_14_0_2_um_filter_42_21]